MRRQTSQGAVSLKVGTIFEDSAIGLEKWLPALWLLTKCNNVISSDELARALGVTQKTAWFMLSRLRLALQAGHGGKTDGEIECNETFIGRKAQHCTKRRRFGISQSRSMIGKVAVMGLLERHRKDESGAQVRTQVIANQKRHQLEPMVADHVVLHGGGSGTSPTYMVNFRLPHGVKIVGLQVTEFPAKDPAFNVIIGMDIIGFGDLSITNVAGKTWMSFRTPSSEAIDYVVQVNKAKYAGVGRNDQCPCGSGKKFKKCHGSLVI